MRATYLLTFAVPVLSLAFCAGLTSQDRHDGGSMYVDAGEGTLWTATTLVSGPPSVSANIDAHNTDSDNQFTDDNGESKSSAYDVSFTLDGDAENVHIEVKALAEAHVKLSADIKKGPGSAEAAGEAEATASYGGAQITAELEDGIAITTAGTPRIIGGGVTIAGFGIQFTTTWISDTPNAKKKDEMQVANGDWAADSDVSTAFNYSVYTWIWVDKGSEEDPTTGDADASASGKVTVMSRMIAD